MGIDFFTLKTASSSTHKESEAPEPENKGEGKGEGIRKHRNSMVYELSTKYMYRRAFSESRLLDALASPGFKFEKGHSYNFLTNGDIDSLSFLKAVLRQQKLSYCLASTWCMGAEDILQFRE